MAVLKAVIIYVQVLTYYNSHFKSTFLVVRNMIIRLKEHLANRFTLPINAVISHNSELITLNLLNNVLGFLGNNVITIFISLHIVHLSIFRVV